jgi:hypothetical protein
MLKKASEFVPKDGTNLRPVGTEEELTFHKVWNFIRMKDFHLPQCACNHTTQLYSCPYDLALEGLRGKVPVNGMPSSWEVYNIDMAGCTQCGALHICRAGSCSVEKNDEGHDICLITGMCVRMLNFSNDEFIDHAAAEQGHPENSHWDCADDANNHCVHNSTWSDEETTSAKQEYAGGPGNHVITKRQKLQDRWSDGKSANVPEGSQNRDTVPNKSAAATCTANIQRGVGASCAIRRIRLDHLPAGGGHGSGRCSVNKKNRYRSWVYQRVTGHADQAPPAGNVFVPGHRQLGLGTMLYQRPPQPITQATGGNQVHSRQHQVQAQLRGKMDDTDRVSDLIQRFTDDVLCSTKWNKSMRIEADKLACKKRSFASRGVDTCTSTVARKSHSNARIPRVDASDEERKLVSSWCAGAIHKHICLINGICRGVITDAKLRSTVIGLLYMIRQGIIVHELVVLPRLPGLSALLPLESHLDTTFNVKAKCITETENVVKIILRNVTKQQLIEAGVARVACRL